MKCFIFIRFRVRDYTNWRNEFELQKEWRKSLGEKNCQTFRDENDLDHVSILFEWKNKESATLFISDPQLSEIMQFAGVMEQPILYLLRQE